jgi:catalase
MKNINKITIILIGLALLFSANTCYTDENHHNTIRFINNSDKIIYVGFSYAYPDTLYDVGRYLNEDEAYKVYHGGSNIDALQRRVFWEDEFRNGDISSDTLMVYVFDAELVESHSTHVNNTIIQRYDLSLSDLQMLQWVLYYLPTEQMKNIKMYPLYDE